MFRENVKYLIIIDDHKGFDKKEHLWKPSQKMSENSDMTKGIGFGIEKKYNVGNEPRNIAENIELPRKSSGHSTKR